MEAYGTKKYYRYASFAEKRALAKNKMKSLQAKVI
jgi:hypothetical protein